MAVDDQGGRSEMSIGKTTMLEEVAMAKLFSASDSSASQEKQICIVNVPRHKAGLLHTVHSNSYPRSCGHILRSIPLCFNTRIQSIAEDLGARL